MKITNNRGDTIVEVLISVAVAGLVIGASYSLASYLLRTATDTSIRSQALAVGQGQIELIKNAQFYYNGQDGILDKYKKDAPQPFCIDLASGNKQNYGDESKPCEHETNGVKYDVKLTYDDSQQLFTELVQWPALNGTTNQLNLYYKVQA